MPGTLMQTTSTVFAVDRRPLGAEVAQRSVANQEQEQTMQMGCRAGMTIWAVNFAETLVLDCTTVQYVNHGVSFDLSRLTADCRRAHVPEMARARIMPAPKSSVLAYLCHLIVGSQWWLSA